MCILVYCGEVIWYACDTIVETCRFHRKFILLSKRIARAFLHSIGTTGSLGHRPINNRPKLKETRIEYDLKFRSYKNTLPTSPT